MLHRVMTNAPATEAVWAELSASLLGYLRRAVRDEAAAQDLLQEAFLRVHTKLPQLPPDARLGPWVFRIAKNLVIDHHRRRGAPTIDFEQVQDVLPSEADEAAPHVELERGLGRWLQGRIEALPERYRAPLRLVELEGHSQKAAASQLDLPYSTVKSRVQRGRARLAADLSRCCVVHRDRRGRVLEVEPRACDCSE